MSAAILFVSWVHDERNVQIGFPAEIDAEFTRQYTDYGIGLIVEPDGTLEDLPISSEPLLPKTIRKESNAAGAFLVRGQETATENRLNPIGLEHVDTDEGTGQSLRLPAVGESEGQLVMCSEGSKHSILRSPIQVVSACHAIGLGSFYWAFLPDNNDPVGVPVRKRTKQNRIYDTKNRCGRSDAESQGKDCHGSKTRVLEQRANGVTEVIKHRG